MARARGKPGGRAAGSRVEDETATLSRTVDARVRKAVRIFRRHAAGVHPRTCPLCGYHGAFTACGFLFRFDAQCARCGLHERHRLVKLLLERTGVIGAAHSVLHFAPEPQLAEAIRALAGTCTTADLMRPRVDLWLDIERLDLPDACFDRIVCCRVLEHADDRRALAEVFRVLRPGGAALLNTPVIEGWDRTYANPEVDGAEMRLVHFGRADHVRYCGRDIRDRIASAGFPLEEFVSEEPDVLRFGPRRGERVLLAWNPKREPQPRGANDEPPGPH